MFISHVWELLGTQSITELASGWDRRRQYSLSFLFVKELTLVIVAKGAQIMKDLNKEKNPGLRA